MFLKSALILEENQLTPPLALLAPYAIAPIPLLIICQIAVTVQEAMPLHVGVAILLRAATPALAPTAISAVVTWIASLLACVPT